jgi:hypothetical protein
MLAYVFDTLARYWLGRRLLFGLHRLGVARETIDDALNRDFARVAGWD